MDQPNNNEPRGRKRKADEAFSREENEGRPRKIRKVEALELTPNEFQPVPGPSGMQETPPNTDSRATPSPDASGMEANSAEFQPVPGPSGIQARRPVDQDRAHLRALTMGPFALGLTPNASFTSRYHVEPVLLGFGKKSRAFEGIRRSDGQKVAIKCVPDPEKKCERFKVPGFCTPVFLEAGMMLELQQRPPSSPYVIHMHEWFEFQDGYILVLRCLSNPWVQLSWFMEENRARINEHLIRGLFRQLVFAAKHCYDNRVFHKKMTPQNIMIHPNTMDLQLIGFGESQYVSIINAEGLGQSLDPDWWQLALVRHDVSEVLEDTLRFMFNYSSVGVSEECLEVRIILAGSIFFESAFDYILESRWMTSDDWTYRSSRDNNFL